MSNLAKINHFSAEQVELIKSTIMSGKSIPTDNDLALFGLICQRAGLDPFAKQIFAIERSGKWTFQISVDGLRAIADRTGLYAGSDEPLFDEGLDLYAFEQSGRKIPSLCRVTVWKIVQGVRCPFVGIARYAEFVQTYNGKPSGLWEKMPLNMLAKCAESQALRKAFPQCNAVPIDPQPIEAVEIQTVDDDWRVAGYQWAINQGVDPDKARKWTNQAQTKSELFQLLQTALPTGVTEEF